MAIVVEHDKRKHEILQKSLDVFIDEGYEDATFQKIADRCGITRTTLYIYFKNKHEIFLGSIKELTSNLEEALIEIVMDDKISAEITLKNIIRKIMEECQKSKKLFCVLLTYLMQLQKSGINTDERVRRRVIKLRHILNTVIIRGINNKEFKGDSIRQMNELLYSLIEASIFRLAVLNQTDVSELVECFDLAIDGFLLK